MHATSRKETKRTTISPFRYKIRGFFINDRQRQFYLVFEIM